MGKIRRMPILLLTTTVRRTSKARTTPLGYVRDGDAYVVFASNGGSETHPAWWLNLEQQPQAQIEVGGSTVAVLASHASGEHEDKLWLQVTEVEPDYGKYRTTLSRKVPVVILQPQL